MTVGELVGDGEDTPSGASAAYGLANWYTVTGDDENATKHLEALVATNSWAAFGFIAAEADLALRQVERSSVSTETDEDRRPLQEGRVT